MVLRGAKKLLLVVKRSVYDVYVEQHKDPHILNLIANKHHAVRNVVERHAAHHSAVQVCRDALYARRVQWTEVRRDMLHSPIEGVDILITVGGDGTLLNASHHVLNPALPVLGVNSDPTQWDEVTRLAQDYDARRSVGHLCAATADTFPQVLDAVLEGSRAPVALKRMRMRIDGALVPTPALNDVLIAHPNPAAASHFTYSIRTEAHAPTPGDANPHGLAHVRSSGMRVCTATGSTAAMASAGGYSMTPLSSDLQYMVREPILPPTLSGTAPKLHGSIFSGEQLAISWGCRLGKLYIDGSHLQHDIKLGTVIHIIADGPPLQVHVPDSSKPSRNQSREGSGLDPIWMKSEA